MKSLKLLLLFPCLLSFSSCTKTYKPKELDPNTTYTNVYLIMGQSNASGVAAHSFINEKDPELYQKYSDGNSKVLISYDCDERVEKTFGPTRWGLGNTEEFFGPEVGIAEKLSENEETSYIIKATYSGSCLMTQYVNTAGRKLKFYNRFIKFIKNELHYLEKENKTPRVRGVFWMQGESDTFLKYSNKYGKAEKYFINYLRTDLNEWIYDHFNFVDAYIYTGGICWVNPEIVNECKQKIADSEEHCYCIKTNGEDETAIKLYLKSETGEGDDLAHYDSSSMLLLGKTAGQYLIK